MQSIPGGTGRNLDSYGHKIAFALSGGPAASVRPTPPPANSPVSGDSSATSSLPAPSARLDYARSILADPQTSGGLLIAVSPDAVVQVRELLAAQGLYHDAIGKITTPGTDLITVL